MLQQNTALTEESTSGDGRQESLTRSSTTLLAAPSPSPNRRALCRPPLPWLHLVLITLLVVAGAFAIYQWGGRVLISRRCRRAISKRPRPAAARTIRRRRAGSPGRTSPTIRRAGARTASTRRRKRHARRSSTSIRRPISRPTAGTRRSRPAATPSSARGCSSRARRAHSTASARSGRRAIARPPTARSCSRARTPRRRSTSPIATSRPRSTNSCKEAGDRPIILAGHSQGALHLERLLREKVAGKPIAKRIVAAYVVGWPISTTADLPALGLPACTAPDQAGCILSWMTFGDPPNPDFIFHEWAKTRGLQRRRAAAARTCSASIRSAAYRTAPRRPQDNPGTLIPTADLRSRDAAAGAVGAHCDKGLLILDGASRRARAVRAAGQQLPRLRLRPVLGRDPARCGAEAGGMASLITADAARIRCRAARRRQARRARRRHQDHRPRDLRCRLAFRRARRDHPPDQVHAGPRSARARSSRASMSSAWSSACRSTWTAATARAPSRSAPSPATSRRSTCRCCCGTSAGRPRRSSGR